MGEWDDLGFDRGLRQRLVRRFGAGVGAWIEELPGVLTDLADRWMLEFEWLIPRGSMSAVIRCRHAGVRPAVLKISPDRARIAAEARVLAHWQPPHVPAVLAVDERFGALLLEAVEPGRALDESAGYPSVEELAALLRSLHVHRHANGPYLPLAARVAYLFDSSLRLYERRPASLELIPPQMYERGRELAMRLAEDASATVLLHGDLTPVNVLDGGNARGLVAIDPAPCLGDPTFDPVDLVLWQAEDLDTITMRAEQLASAVGENAERLFAWCSAFAAMTALERAETGDISEGQLETYVQLAAQA